MILHKDDIFKEVDVFFKFIDADTIYNQLHSHDFFEIFFIINGSIKYSVNNIYEELHSNTVIFVHPSDNHQLTGIADTQILNIAFSQSLFSQLIHMFGYDTSPIIQRSITLRPDLIKTYIEQIRELTASYQSQDSQIILKSILVSLLTKLILSSENTQMNYPFWLQQFLNDISSITVFPEHINTILARSDKSNEHISRTFRKYLNTSPTEYINQLRIDYAMGLLVTTSQSILDIALISGFNNLSYFYRSFKAKYGITPKQYRAKYSSRL